MMGADTPLIARRSVSQLGRIQVLRFVAALAVLIAHLEHELAEHVSAAPAFSLRGWIDGGIGVDIFFFISGLIMYMISAGQFGRPGATATFWTRRLLRVAPLYYLATIATIAAGRLFAREVADNAMGVGQIVKSFLFIPYANDQGQISPILKLGWTLNYEAFFYLLFGIALAFHRRAGLFFLFGALASMILLALLFGDRSVLLRFWGQDIVLEFLGGIIIAAIMRRGVTIPRAPAWAMIGGAIVLAVVMRRLGAAEFLPRSVFAGVPVAILVAGVALAPDLEGKGHGAALLRFGGDASYALYLSHPFSLRGASLMWAHSGLHSPIVYILFTVLMAMAVAAAVHVGVERPLSRLFRREAPARAAPPASEMA